MPTDIQRTKWNIWVWNNFNKSTTLLERIYWKSMFV